MEIRRGAAGDVRAITDILNHYILSSNARFETEVLSVDDRIGWMRQFQGSVRHQLFVAETEHTIAGFACTQRYRPGQAFEDTAEVSIFLRPDAGGKGIGSRLYETLFDAVSGSGLHRALAGIALPNDGSVALHRKFGFREIGVFSEYAKKNGQRISSVWLEKPL